MVMAPATNAIMVCPISKLNPVEQTCCDKHLDGAVDGCTSHVGLDLAELLPEIIRREIGSTGCKFGKSLCNESSWACIALAHIIEDGINMICSHR